MKEEVSAEGRKAYVIPGGGSNPIGATGYVTGLGAGFDAQLYVKNEAVAAASLKHPNIVQVYSVGCERGIHYYAMEYVEGETLAEVIRQLRQEAGGGQRSEDSGQKSDVGGQKSEDRGQKSEVRSQRSEASGRRTEVSVQTPLSRKRERGRG